MSNDTHGDTLIVLRHGIRSSHDAMAKIEQRLKTMLPGCTTDNETYDWGDFVLHSGIALAGYVIEKLNETGRTKVILIGHSQGGLVCRVAVAALCARADFVHAVRKRATPGGGYYTLADQALQRLAAGYTHAQLDAAKAAVHSVVLLGTPNAGAITNGQLAVEMTLALRALKKLASVKWRNFDELTTDRLFTLLQDLRVRRVRYVSVSGSSFNRYSDFTSSHLSLLDLPLLSRLAPSLALPNDGVVEDVSVNMREAPLPPEIADLDAQYTHVRCYTECIRVAHGELHSDPNTLDALESVSGWM